MNKFQYLTIACLFLLLGVRSSLACSCIPPKSPSETLKEAAAVFSGKVLKIRRQKTGSGSLSQVEVVMRVETVWKGVDKTTIRISTASHSDACGYSFKEGNSYLVYAYGNAEDLSTSICSRTRRLSDAQDDLRELGKGKTSTKS